MTRLFFALILIITVFAQATIFPALNLLGIGPNIVLVLVLVWSGMRGASEGLIWAFPLGILLDLLTLDPIGTNGLALIPVALIGGLASRRLLHSGIIIPMLAVVGATVAHQAVGAFIALFTGPHYSLLVTAKLGLLMTLLNIVVVPPLYLFVQLMERMGVGRAAQA